MNPIEKALSWIIGISILGLVLWAAFFKPTDKITNQPDSKPTTNNNTRWPFTIDLNFSCTRSLVEQMKK